MKYRQAIKIIRSCRFHKKNSINEAIRITMNRDERIKRQQTADGVVELFPKLGKHLTYDSYVYDSIMSGSS